MSRKSETVLPFVDSFGMTFPVALDRDGQVSTLYRVRGLPTTFFIDADGIVRQAHRGTIRSSTQLNELLEYDSAGGGRRVGLAEPARARR